MSEVHLDSWRNSAAIGQSIVYHTGFIANDRLRYADVDKVGNDAWSLASRGRVCLTQRKINIGKYDYIAVASALKPWPIESKV